MLERMRTSSIAASAAESASACVPCPGSLLNCTVRSLPMLEGFADLFDHRIGLHQLELFTVDDNRLPHGCSVVGRFESMQRVLWPRLPKFIEVGATTVRVSVSPHSLGAAWALRIRDAVSEASPCPTPTMLPGIAIPVGPVPRIPI